MTESLRGRVLLATPLLREPAFDRTVVLLLEHGEDGALGLVLNRPTATRVDDAMPGWAPLCADPVVVFDGGPVDGSAAICLGSTRPGAAAHDVQAVTPTVGVLDLSRDPAALTAEVGTARIFAGYAGWSPGQLEQEIALGAWFVVDSVPTDPFSAAPQRLWRAALRRQPSRVALFSTFPDDPAAN